MNSVERAAPEPSQGRSSLEAELDEQDRLNVPQLLRAAGGYGIRQSVSFNSLSRIIA
jgi:hypothetical protein